MEDSDSRTKIKDLKELVRKFRRERGWHRGFKARSFAISLVLEACEFLEHFQWREDEEVLEDSEEKRELSYELADVLYWVLAIADSLQIDLSKTLREKLKKQEKKYPLKRFSKEVPKKESLKRYYSIKKKKRWQINKG